MSGSREGSAYPPVKDRMSRARTPLGSVPISTIYGFEYPISNGIERDYSSKSILKTSEVKTSERVQPLWKKGTLTDSVDYMVKSSRAFSENRLADPYYSTPVSASLSFMPMALRASRSNTPVPSSYREFSVPPVERSTARSYVQAVPDVAPRTTSMTLSSTSPWDSTGFYYSPRYPQSHRGTASTYSSVGSRQYSRRYFDDFNYFNPYAYGNPVRSDYFRYPVRRFVPSYVPFRYSRR